MSQDADPSDLDHRKLRQTIADAERLEQDARIALMDHFRFYLQYWGTILVALAAAFLSIVGLGRFTPPLSAFLGVLIVGQAVYAVVMTVVHQELCALAASKSRVKPTENKTDYVTWLHNTTLNDLNKWYRWIRTWYGWGVISLVSFIGANWAYAYFDPAGLQLPWRLAVTGIALAATFVVSCFHVKRDKAKQI